MRTLTETILSSLVSGSVAGVVTAGVNGALAAQRGRPPWQPVNATSHWLHGDAAGDFPGVDAAHTGVGLATHQGSAVFWAFVFETWLANRPPRGPAEMLRDATVMSGIAALVDYGLVPKRVTPGWEEVLPPRSIAVTYAALALGLAAGALLSRSMRGD